MFNTSVMGGVQRNTWQQNSTKNILIIKKMQKMKGRLSGYFSLCNNSHSPAGIDRIVLDMESINIFMSTHDPLDRYIYIIDEVMGSKGDR